MWQKAKVVLESGTALVVDVRLESKTSPQERLYHTYIGKISKQASHLNCKFCKDDWKRFLVDAYLRETKQESGRILPNLDGSGFVQLGLQTRKFNKKQASEFVTWLEAWCAENGVILDES